MMPDIGSHVALNVSHTILAGQTALLMALVFLLLDWLANRQPEVHPYD
jgi:hypothetical protein